MNGVWLSTKKIATVATKLCGAPVVESMFAQDFGALDEHMKAPVTWPNTCARKADSMYNDAKTQVETALKDEVLWAKTGPVCHSVCRAAVGNWSGCRERRFLDTGL